MSDTTNKEYVRVWDLPLRLFHWGFAMAVFGAIGSAKAGVMWAHERFGLLILALLAFRLIWGFVGGHHARFINFLVWPRQLFLWLRAATRSSSSDVSVGHSPIAGYSVIGLLFVPLIMGLTGIISTDGILFDGPLAHLVPAWSANAAKAHHNISWALFILVGLHIAAIVFYKMIKKKGLTAAMVHGRAIGHATAAGPDGHISRAKTAFGLALIASLVAGAQMIVLLRPAYF